MQDSKKMCVGWKSRGENTICGNISFRPLSHKHERTHCTHHQINFSLIYVRTLSGSRGVARASRFPWVVPQYVGNPGNESGDMWARGTGSRPSWSRQQRRFDSHFSYSWEGGLQRDRLHYFTRWGRFSGTGKVKQHKKTKNFCRVSWSDCAKLLTVVQMWPPQAVEQHRATVECLF